MTRGLLYAGCYLTGCAIGAGLTLLAVPLLTIPRRAFHV